MALYGSRGFHPLKARSPLEAAKAFADASTESDCQNFTLEESKDNPLGSKSSRFSYDAPDGPPRREEIWVIDYPHIID